MKPWMKVLMWLGLGGGIGFFAGYHLGRERGDRQIAEIQMNEWASYEGGYNQALRDNGIVKTTETWEDAKIALEKYRGEQSEEPEEDEIPEELVPPVIGDEKDIEEIPYPHPQYFVPEQISEDEYYANPWGYDQEQLYFYELDEVLYNKETRKAIKDKDTMDQVIGIGMTFNFYKSDGEVLDAIFVRNDTTGTIFRIDRLEAAYTDEIDGGDSPEYEAEDDTE